MTNHLYYGDNLHVLRNNIADASVDLVYLDPPFNSNANYNVLFKSPEGAQSHAQIEAFEDTWHWTADAEQAFDEVMQSGHGNAAEMLRAMRSFLGENDMMAYLTMMAVRLIELHRVLKDTGSLYLHCDPTASHYLKIILDGIFGKENFGSEVIWKRTSAHNSAKRWGPIHDVILFATKSSKYTWNKVHQSYDDSYLEKSYRFVDENGNRFTVGDLTGAGIRSGESGKAWKKTDPTSKGRHWAVPRNVPGLEDMPSSILEALDFLDAKGRIYWPPSGGTPRFKRFLNDMRGVQIQDVIEDIPALSAQAKERLGYPTQKPVALMERILSASSNEGDVVLDPFCGCGTTIHAAQKLNRHWIGIDITHLSVSLIEKRLRDAFPAVKFEVHGTPKDVAGAFALAEADKYQFQWWAVSLVNAVPFGGKKKGADGGIDGHIYFKPDGKTTEKAIVSVKGGLNVSVPMIRDLAHVVDREKAKIGVFITLAEPTAPMKTEAIKAGYYETEQGKFPKLQILTIEELFAGKKPLMPWLDPHAFKKATLETTQKQNKLL
jgi:adenine specific DNA methylase Mod